MIVRRFSLLLKHTSPPCFLLLDMAYTALLLTRCSLTWRSVALPVRMPSTAALECSQMRLTFLKSSQVWMLNIKDMFFSVCRKRQYVFVMPRCAQFVLDVLCPAGNGKVSCCAAAEGSFTALTGLLEVEPLPFTCISTSDGTRVERDDASMFTGKPS